MLSSILNQYTSHMSSINRDPVAPLDGPTSSANWSAFMWIIMQASHLMPNPRDHHHNPMPLTVPRKNARADGATTRHWNNSPSSMRTHLRAHSQTHVQTIFEPFGKLSIFLNHFTMPVFKLISNRYLIWASHAQLNRSSDTLDRWPIYKQEPKRIN